MQPSSPKHLSLFIPEQKTTIANPVITSPVTTPLTANTASVPASPVTPPRLVIQTSPDTSTSPVSPRNTLSPRVVPRSPRLFNSKNSSREMKVEKVNSDTKSEQILPTLMLTPKSHAEKYDDNPPPYSLTGPYARPSSPDKSTINFPDSEKNDSETKETLYSNEPVLSPRRSRITRQVAALRRNPTDVTEQINISQALSPRGTQTYSREKIISSLSNEITNSALIGKPAKLEIINTLGRIDAVFNLDELPEELQSLCKSSADKKISSTELMRDLFSSEFKSGAAWAKAKEFIQGAKLMSDSTIKMGETDETIKNNKSLILKPLAEDIALCLIGNRGLIADMAMPKEFIEKFLFQADQKVLEWALKSDSLSVEDINRARSLFFYNLVVIRFIQPMIAAEFGDNPSQMDSWMQSLILNELKPNIFNAIKDFLGKSGAEMPEKLNLQFNTKANLELRSKRIAEIQKNNSATKERKFTFSKDDVLKTKEKNKLKNAERNNLGILKEIKAICGISDIGGKFSNYIESDIEKWLSLDVKMDRQSIILNLSFALYNYLANNSNEADSDGNLSAIKKASEILDGLVIGNISDDAKRHTTFLGEDLKSTLYQDSGKYESSLNLMSDNNSDIKDSKSEINFDVSNPGAMTLSPTAVTTVTALNTPATKTTTTDVTSFAVKNTVKTIDENLKENKS